jgi:hypothetical protein
VKCITIGRYQSGYVQDNSPTGGGRPKRFQIIRVVDIVARKLHRHLIRVSSHLCCG